jgi:hypothetical protein
MVQMMFLARLVILAVLVCILALAVGCGGQGALEEYQLDVTLGKTTPVDLVKWLGPPTERTTNHRDRPIERLYFNVPYYRVIHVNILNQGSKKSEKIIRGKSIISFYFDDGLLSAVE